MSGEALPRPPAAEDLKVLSQVLCATGKVRKRGLWGPPHVRFHVELNSVLENHKGVYGLGRSVGVRGEGEEREESVRFKGLTSIKIPLFPHK